LQQIREDSVPEPRRPRHAVDSWEEGSAGRLDGLRYHLHILGCQMNRHDAERVAGMLDLLGAQEVEEDDVADIIVFMTCCVRERADERLYGQVASLGRTAPDGRRRLIAIGGCIGQRDGDALLRSFDNVDVVFGTHNIAHLPALITRALSEMSPQVEVLESSEGFATDLPQTREVSWHAWVPITTGCDNFCSYCIVPYVRGREKSRTLEDIGSEFERLAEAGVKELTLLGQNVNSYGRDLYGKPRFAEVLRMAGTSGIPRIRFATSHPKDLLPETIHAMASYPAVMPALHLPVQSGSDRVLAAMNRHYTAAHYLSLIDRVRDEVGDVAFSTDIIVGFPGETEEDFQQTLELCRTVGYTQAFTFIYSRREGTPAAKIDDPTPAEVIQRRFDELVATIQDGAWQANQHEVGRTVPVLVEGPSKRDPGILMGRDPKNQVVHAPLPQKTSIEQLTGTFVDVRIDLARTWYLSGQVV